jgi:AraC family transcriptional regulator, regulatory protein of adaptative response / DNA-3-methyladenine glycosylase II
MTSQADDQFYLALKARDARFDGCFFTGVTSTGIYCRPVCRVKAPKRENCRFFGHAAQAEAAGFRPCLRCRPELAPYSLNWSIQDASRSLALQAARMLDDVSAPFSHVAELAAKLGVSDRHLRRIFEAQLGVSPLQYLQTRRLLTAKQLLTDTNLPVAQVAALAGFDSLRRFNAAFALHYRLSPSQLRKEGGAGHTRSAAGVLVNLAYRPPYDVQAMLGFFKARQIAGVEYVQLDEGKAKLARTLRIRHESSEVIGWLEASFDQARCTLQLRLSDSLRPALPSIARRVRAALDLDADPRAIASVLGQHFPGMDGLRVPGTVSGFELAVRAILGQQITVAAARTLTQRLVNLCGDTIDTPYPELSRLFPSAEQLAKVGAQDLGALGIVRQRQADIRALAQAVASGELDLDQTAAWDSSVQALKALPGIGDWTAQYIAMRALRWPDAFPAGDVALQNALQVREHGGKKLSPSKAAQMAEAASQAWRPWRSYAVLRCWASLPPKLKNPKHPTHSSAHSLTNH